MNRIRFFFLFVLALLPACSIPLNEELPQELPQELNNYYVEAYAATSSIGVAILYREDYKRIKGKPSIKVTLLNGLPHTGQLVWTPNLVNDGRHMLYVTELKNGPIRIEYLPNHTDISEVFTQPTSAEVRFFTE